MFEPFWVWLILAAILVLIELLTVSFGVICFAFGAGFAAIIAKFSDNVYWQMSGFVVCSILIFIFIRPIILRYLNKKNGETPMNAEGLISRKAIVTETIDAKENSGRVKIDGDDWRAQEVDNQRVVVGEKVEIVGRESLVLFVKKL